MRIFKVQLTIDRVKENWFNWEQPLVGLETENETLEDHTYTFVSEQLLDVDDDDD